jgi:hypothetical protein
MLLQVHDELIFEAGNAALKWGRAAREPFATTTWPRSI